jgi:hypothetical protein
MALDGGELQASRPGRFTPEGTPQYPLDRRLGGPQNQSGRDVTICFVSSVFTSRPTTMLACNGASMTFYIMVFIFSVSIISSA